MASGTFATAINCIDGRVQSPVADWLKTHRHVTFVDSVTTPGPDKLLTSDQTDQIEQIRQHVLISVNAHHSQNVVIAGHHECAAYPGSREEHIASIRQAARLVESWGLPVQVTGVWVNDWWQVEVVYPDPEAR